MTSDLFQHVEQLAFIHFSKLCVSLCPTEKIKEKKIKIEETKRGQ